MLLKSALLIAATMTAAAATPPNLVFIMSDDQDGNQKQDWAQFMPKLKEHMQDGGTRFEAHVADEPQCGPSRSSTLTGRLAHNHGYFINADPTGKSFVNWMNNGNNNTIGTWLTRAGYHTAFLGKFINSFECVPNPTTADGKPTWSYWHATCNTYVLYNTSYIANDGELIVRTGEYQTDTLAKEAVGQIEAAHAAAKPFYIHITPVAPHASTCYRPGGEAKYPWCEERDNGKWFCDKQPFVPKEKKEWQAMLRDLYDWEHSFTGENGQALVEDGVAPAPAPPSCSLGMLGVSPCVRNTECKTHQGLTNPHMPQWNASMDGKPSFLNFLPPTSALEAAAENRGYVDRIRSLTATDDLIDTIIQKLTALGILDDTFIFYTADNGYHLGEHRLPTGKCEPFESDVQLTFWARGPGIPAGRVSQHPTQHTDFAATFLELSGAAAPAEFPIDGKSLVPVLMGQEDDDNGGAGGRDYTYSEFFLACSTWRKVRIANFSLSTGESHRVAFHAWCTNQTEVYFLDQDPAQLHDMSGTIPIADLRVLTQLSAMLGQCAGAKCSAPLAQLRTEAEQRVAAAVSEEGLRDAENIPTQLACYHGVNTEPWCCGQSSHYEHDGKVVHQYDCVDVVGRRQ